MVVVCYNPCNMGMQLVLAFGSNLGNRVSHIESGVRVLGSLGVELIRLSSFYETRPTEYEAQPPFINCVGVFRTELDVFDVLHAVLETEVKAGRSRSIPKGPRTLDIDMISCGMKMVQTNSLNLPHPSAVRRLFVLMPLAEIDADSVLPGYGGRTVSQLLAACEDRMSQPVRLRFPPKE